MINSHQLIKPMMATLFKAEERRLQLVIDGLHKQNLEASGIQADGFMYEGRFYMPTGAKHGSGLRPTLHLSLWPSMMEHMRDTVNVLADKQLIQQTLFKLYDHCINNQDIRCATPDSIVDTLPADIQTLDRCRQPSFFLNHPRDFRQLEKALPKIDFYSACRLVY